MFTRRRMLTTTGLVLAGGTLLGPKAFGQEKELDKDLIFRTTDPRNGEPSLDKLVQSWITPTKHFYVRSHAPNPKLDANSFRLKLEGLVNKPVDEIPLARLANLGKQKTTATLTCAGNRRAEFNAEGKVGGVQWEAGAIGNATWSGCPLARLLKAAELKPEAKHVWFEGLDQIPKSGKVISFGGSIPIEKAMIENGPAAPLLATMMNGEELTPDHGYPLRALVPGYIGARSVKWLGKIVISDRPSPNHYLATAYKIVKKTEPIDWRESGPIYRYPINAAICTPEKDARLTSGEVELKGYVLPTGRANSKVKTVQISSDGGKSWQAAEMTGTDTPFCWQIWKATVNVTKETKRLYVRATDTSGNFMPGKVKWNAKGYLQNSWYRLRVNVE